MGSPSRSCSFRQGPNLPLAYTWPWSFGHLHLAWYERLCLAAAFLIPVFVLPLGAALAWSSTAAQLKQRATVIAGTAVGIFFAHHVAVRSDAIHLAASMQPLLLICMALPRAFRCTRHRLVKVALWGFLGVMTLPAVWSSNGIPERLLVDRLASHWRGREPLTMAAYDARGDQIYLDVSSAAYLASLHRIIIRYVEPDEPLFIAQAHPTLYALFDKMSPVWGIYFLWPAERSTQQEMIQRLDENEVNWALIAETAVDGRPELMFRNSHSIVWEYLMRSFEPVASDRLPVAHTLLRRRSP